MKTMTKLILTTCVASAMLPGFAMAQETTGQGTNQGYWVSSSGKVVKDPYGLCWRAGYWTSAMANEECDPDLVPKRAEPVVVAEAPPPPAPAAPPAPATVVTMPKKVSFSADALFDFDKDTLKPAGKDLITGLVHQLNGVSYDTIKVTGHTDRIGSVSYNLKLSQRRANSVKTFMESQGIDGSRIVAEGKGKSEPVTAPGDCKGKVSKKVIACLQPDRRVDVEVTGAK